MQQDRYDSIESERIPGPRATLLEERADNIPRISNKVNDIEISIKVGTCMTHLREVESVFYFDGE